MVMPSRFEDAEQYVRRYAVDNDGQLPTMKMVQQYTNVCADTMSNYAKRLARIGIVLPRARPGRNIDADTLKTFVDEFQAKHERLPLTTEFRKHFDFRGAQLQRMLNLLEMTHGIALAEFIPRPIVPKPDPEYAQEEKPLGRSTRNERKPRPDEECPLGLRLVVYRHRDRVLKFYRADCSDTSEPASFIEAVKRLKELDAAGVHTSIA